MPPWDPGPDIPGRDAGREEGFGKRNPVSASLRDGRERPCLRSLRASADVRAANCRVNRPRQWKTSQGDPCQGIHRGINAAVAQAGSPDGGNRDGNRGNCPWVTQSTWGQEGQAGWTSRHPVGMDCSNCFGRTVGFPLGGGTFHNEANDRYPTPRDGEPHNPKTDGPHPQLIRSTAKVPMTVFLPVFIFVRGVMLNYLGKRRLKV